MAQHALRVESVPPRPPDSTRLFGAVAMPGALQVAPFRRIWGALLLIHLSRWIEITAIGWIVVEATGSPFLVSLAVFVRLAPFLVAGPVGGALADRVNRVWFIRVTTMGRVAVAALLAGGLIVAGPNIPLIYALTAIGGVFASSVIPALRSLIPEIVPPRQLTSGLGFETLAFTISLIVGPLIAGLLLPWVNPAYLFVGTTIAYAVATLAMFAVPTSISGSDDGPEGDPSGAPVGPGLAGLWRSILDGVAVARARPEVMGVLAVAGAAEGFAFSFLHLIPIFATDVLDGGPGVLGALWSAEGLGELLGSIMLVSWLGGRIRSPGRALLISVVAAMLIGIPLGLSSTLPLTFFLLFSLGSVVAVFAIMQSQVILVSTPPRMRGRLVGIQSMFIVAFPVGAVIAGALADVFGPHVAVVTMSLTGLALILLIAVRFPQLRTTPAAERSRGPG